MSAWRDIAIAWGRRVAAPILLAVALGGCETLAEVDRGLYDVTSVAAEQDRITGLHALSIEDRQMQIDQGNAYGEQFLAQLRASGQPINEEIDAAAYDRLLAIFARVHQVGHMREEDWDVVMLPDREINAFVTGGSMVFVNHGTVVRLPDDEVAAILGHEIAHVAANHVFEERATMIAELAVGKGRSAGLDAAYSRNAEAEADRVGTVYAALGGYDPFAAPRLWQRMARTYPRAPGYLDSHPLAEERLAETRRIAALSRAYYRPDEINPDHADVLACNTVFCRVDGGVEPGEGGGFFAATTLALEIMRKRLEAEAEEERRRAETNRLSPYAVPYGVAPVWSAPADPYAAPYGAPWPATSPWADPYAAPTPGPTDPW